MNSVKSLKINSRQAIQNFEHGISACTPLPYSVLFITCLNLLFLFVQVPTCHAKASNTTIMSIKLYISVEFAPSSEVDKNTLQHTTFIYKKKIHSMQDCTTTRRHRVTRKRSKKILKHARNLFRKNLQLRGVC